MKDNEPPRTSAHAETRSRQRVDRRQIPEACLAALWQAGRPAQRSDFDRFCAVQLPDKAYRVAIKAGEAYLVVKSLTTGIFITVIRQYRSRS